LGTSVAELADGAGSAEGSGAVDDEVCTRDGIVAFDVGHLVRHPHGLPRDPRVLAVARHAALEAFMRAFSTAKLLEEPWQVPV